MIRENPKRLLLTIAASALLACGARPKSTPNDEVTAPWTIEDEAALEEGAPAQAPVAESTTINQPAERP